jgi:molybdopterin-guanine dinucleotide biosynthesis adapter protein
MRVLGIVGFKNSGKTTLVEGLVAELVRRGRRVCTVKHAHHDIEVDRPGKDSHRHRMAGATAVAVVSPRRWAVMHELRGAAEPTLDEVLQALPPCDLVLVEGYRALLLPKLEVRDGSDAHPPLSDTDPHVLAVASPGAPVAGVERSGARFDAANAGDSRSRTQSGDGAGGSGRQ